MNDSIFDETLWLRKCFLDKIISEKTAALDGCLPGKLRIVRRGKNSYYYWRTDPKDTNGIYLPHKEYNVARSLAQKYYDQKILHAAQEELALIKQIRSVLSLQSVESCSLALEETYRGLINPVVLSDEAFAQQWQNMPYHQKSYWEDGKEYYTNRGERVRSKSELIIANTLNDRNIPYRYECVCNLDNYNSVYPDFTVLNVRKRKEYLWEHLGMMDNMDYVQKTIRKLSLYEKNGYYPGDKLILTHESGDQPLKSNLIHSLIEVYLL